MEFAFGYLTWNDTVQTNVNPVRVITSWVNGICLKPATNFVSNGATRPDDIPVELSRLELKDALGHSIVAFGRQPVTFHFEPQTNNPRPANYCAKIAFNDSGATTAPTPSGTRTTSATRSLSIW